MGDLSVVVQLRLCFVTLEFWWDFQNCPHFFPFPGYKAGDDSRQVVLPPERPGKHKNCACGKRFQHWEKCQPIPCICWSQQCKTRQWEDMFPNSRSDSALKTICWWTGSSAQQPNVTGFLTFPSPNKTQLLLTRDSCNIDHVWLTSGQIGGEQ